ncbi:hypothetical protein P43SY_006367 [Pythium insidiosum]|uniref:AGC protein kinase n=1 Tax=Pythium insidiosum TaxID=114742 RepID=A0AAD5Q3W8_PYTIN|nr:hypothetical protein P43SY_006367 [Pythium insidiosum]
MGGGLSTGGHGRSSYRYGVGGGHPADADPPEGEREVGAGAGAPLLWIGQRLELPPKPFNLATHFKLHCVLGTGMLGRVRLVQHLKSRQFFALKSMKKADIVAHDMLRHVDAERQAFQRLTKLQHPFLAKFFGSFQTPNHVHLVLEYVPGGELFRRLHQVGRFSNDETKFYATELVAFVESCHQQRYMYRDLKPENVLLDADGHIKVVDLGFVRRFEQRSERCSTDVGTPQYLAPEQLTQSRDKRHYTCVVDWWALACMVFEMMAGKTPFAQESKHDSPFELYTRILQGKIQWPRGMSSTLRDLLRRMLEPELGARLCDADAIKAHAWFSDVDWQDVQRRDVPAPFRPRLGHDGDRSHFDDIVDANTNELENGNGKGATDAFALEFRNF